jgi:hypothetical protein
MLSAAQQAAQSVGVQLERAAAALGEAPADVAGAAAAALAADARRVEGRAGAGGGLCLGRRCACECECACVRACVHVVRRASWAAAASTWAPSPPLCPGKGAAPGRGWGGTECSAGFL